ncbi:uncharacterized protein LOC122082204 [Macadamia integrifolia]|uniref:uncharacterized protein LOC122082204 n=1 Tax=Macadamia integrifolia TaxID=60698 RepID=UPI001C4E874D|nr:uncharacterized protein LOC122082204 [Macadamia integrifolia]
MLPRDNQYSICHIGFGVDSTGKYKVIKMWSNELESDSSNEDDDERFMMKGEIITLGESSWREIAIPSKIDFAIDCQLQLEMVFMNGALYSIMKKPKDRSQQPMILVFDLHDKKFYTIEFPGLVLSLL